MYIKMLHQKAPTKCLILFLGFSFLILSLAVPTRRSLKSTTKDHLLTDSAALGALNFRKAEEIFEEVEGFVEVEGRMELERNDYPGTGANNHHDPRTPGRA